MTQSKNYIKPRVNKALFYFRDCWDYEWALFRLLDKELGIKGENYNHEMPKALQGKLPPIVITLKYYPFVSGMISNGGFNYMLESYLGWKTLPCIEGLIELEEYDTVQILLYAHAVYELNLRNESLPEEIYVNFQAQTSDDKITQIHAYLKEHVANFDDIAKNFRLKTYNYDEYASHFYRITYQTMQNVVEHIRANPNDYVTDEDGKPFDLSFTGIYDNPNDTIKYVLPMQDGKPHGSFKLFNERKEVEEITGEFENGFLKSYSETYQFESGYYIISKYNYEKYKNTVIEIRTVCFKNSDQPEEQTSQYKYSLGNRMGEQKEWYEDGQTRSVKYYENDNKTQWKYYNEDGTLSGEGTINENNEQTSTNWFSNGNILREEFIDEKGLKQQNRWAEDGTLIICIKYDEEGNYLGHHNYYPNGQRMSIVYESENEKDKMQSFWDKKGNQTLKDGNGYVEDYSSCVYQCIYSEYKNGLKHGIERGVKHDGSIVYETRFENGFRKMKRII